MNDMFSLQLAEKRERASERERESERETDRQTDRHCDEERSTKCLGPVESIVSSTVIAVSNFPSCSGMTTFSYRIAFWTSLLAFLASTE